MLLAVHSHLCAQLYPSFFFPYQYFYKKESLFLPISNQQSQQIFLFNMENFC
jgi:hypothetical protein